MDRPFYLICMYPTPEERPTANNVHRMVVEVYECSLNLRKMLKELARFLHLWQYNVVVGYY